MCAMACAFMSGPSCVGQNIGVATDAHGVLAASVSVSPGMLAVPSGHNVPLSSLCLKCGFPQFAS